MSALSRLQRVALTDIWTTEAQHFTPWLAREENLALLGGALELELEHEATEKNVGPFRADILCKDLADGSWVLIENQLGRTDHPHLGQLLTYASGLKAVTIIWIAAAFTDEHRAALDWLNSITEDDFRFFGLEVELWRIDDSAAAPKFNIVSKPNEWSKSVSKGKREIDAADLTGVKATQFEYWTAFAETATARSKILRPQKPRPQHWTSMSIGRSGFYVSALVNSRDNLIGVELVMADENAKPHFDLLEQEKTEIESELGTQLNWKRLSDGKHSKIDVWKADVDFRKETDWPQQHAWLIDMLERFHKVFSDRIRSLDAENWEPPSEPDEFVIET
ncbi:DUF4268 domain-containing protein [Hyphobacterium marinum]|uniref:DUF4268 domain-containing protein n=1 Tax=Hyphobacterium marinum TaxID=3116574 RepID=A0ABU7M016_9PROT|nr:DUF4268 domain-containing protein [Hyphobacterium sp. Y6023]MEE2567143.1 DUF4268 domain-containing protein [Hyphobacterium sp. Y6023]